MKEIVLDTETTGISVKEGHRIVEIGCIELENLIQLKINFIVTLILKEKSQKKLYKCMVILMNFYLTKKNLKK